LFDPFVRDKTIFEMRLKVSCFHETFKISKDFSRENHGHGGHEHMVSAGGFGGKLSFKNVHRGGPV
jgi:hypothetical protein